MLNTEIEPQRFFSHALLVEKNTAKADQIRKEFDQCAKSYPYQNDIQSERELMEIARNHTTEL